MFNHYRPSRNVFAAFYRSYFVLSILLALAACQVSSTRPAPTPFATIESQPIAGGPVLLRKGISLRKVIEVGANNIRLVRNPSDGQVYLLSPAQGIFRIKDLSAAASLELVATSDEINGVPAGLAFGPNGTVYVVLNSVVNKTKTQVLVRKGVPNGQGRFNWQTLATSDPYPLSNTYYDHLYNGIVVSPDGKWLYINGGARTDHGEVEDNGGAFPNTRDVPLTAKILRLPTNAAELQLPNDEAALTALGLIFAQGTRNAYDMAFAPNGDLFAVDNGPDADYPDELNWIRQGLNYGFPWRFGTQDNPQRMANYDPSKDLRLQSGFYAVDHGFYHKDLGFPQPPSAFTDPVINLGPDAMKYRGDDGKEYDAYAQGKTLSTFTPHRSPLGLVFVADSKMPAQWRSTSDSLSAFILSWGAAGGTLSDKGQDLLHMQLTKKGDNYQAVTYQVARGFQNPIDSVLIENRLYILEYGGNGGIWELTFQ